MKISIRYSKTGKTDTIEVDGANVGPGGIAWWTEKTFGFVGFCKDWDVTILPK